MRVFLSARISYSSRFNTFLGLLLLLLSFSPFLNFHIIPDFTMIFTFFIIFFILFHTFPYLFITLLYFFIFLKAHFQKWSVYSKVVQILSYVIFCLLRVRFTNDLFWHGFCNALQLSYFFKFFQQLTIFLFFMLSWIDLQISWISYFHISRAFVLNFIFKLVKFESSSFGRKIEHYCSKLVHVQGTIRWFMHIDVSCLNAWTSIRFSRKCHFLTWYIHFSINWRNRGTATTTWGFNWCNFPKTWKYFQKSGKYRPGDANVQFSLCDTVWKFHNFSISYSELSRNWFWDPRSAKCTISTHLEALNFEFLHSLKAKIFQSP